ncbi:uncharacterized protein LOC111058416 [Nilaparvata lugens]|uniref:uncharacterized protein LOC111058416 n=1 Tax=Nilaparvata lugens TaxID=108931 RepID=UPI00193E000C|nr:uncharacterized protein LOC111058416 [Nilaparvata lugens]
MKISTGYDFYLKAHHYNSEGLIILEEANSSPTMDLTVLKTKCLKESGAKNGVVRKLIGKPVIPEGTVEKCFLACVYKGLGVVAPNDTFVPEKVKFIANQLLYGQNMKITKMVADACTTEIKADPDEKCSIGESFRACFIKKGMDGMAYGIVAAELEKIKNSCLKKVGATEDTARRLVGVNVVSESHLENCFLTCMYKAMKIMSSDYKFVPDTVRKIADDHFLGKNLKVTYQIADLCTKEIKADPADKCSFGGSLRTCFSKYAKELGFFPHI